MQKKKENWSQRDLKLAYSFRCEWKSKANKNDQSGLGPGFTWVSGKKARENISQHAAV